MRILFLGTGAAEGNPAMFCRCRYCQAMRRSAGKDLRSRSSLRLGDCYQIDMAPDVYWQMVRCNTDMYDVEHILFTHSHGDHFEIEAVLEKELTEQMNGRPLWLYMSRPARDIVDQAFLRFILRAAGKGPTLRHEYKMKALDYFAEYRIGDLHVDTIKGSHKGWGTDEVSINYLIRLPDSRRLLYALDTGYYSDEIWEYLQGRYTDILIMDCTFGGRTDRGELPEGHLNIASFVRTLDRMSSIGFIDAETRLFATHINPHQGLLHDDFQRKLDESSYRVTLAYDGLSFDSSGD